MGLILRIISHEEVERVHPSSVTNFNGFANEQVPVFLFVSVTFFFFCVSSACVLICVCMHVIFFVCGCMCVRARPSA